jgi:molybdopterin-containing oxidoreductase family membrane subunit
MVVLIAASLRRALSLESVLRPAHFDAMAKVLLAAALVMGLSYATEWFTGWWSGDPAELRFLQQTFDGPYTWLYLLMLACNVVSPQLFWWPAMRTNMKALVGVSLAVLVGMWFERMLILLNTLSFGYEPSFWRLYWPTAVDFMILFGTLGMFTLLMLIFSRLFPVVSIYETRELAREAGAA